MKLLKINESIKKGLKKMNEEKGYGIVLAIVGSRKMKDKQLFAETMKEFICDYGFPDRIVSGGAVGADKMGEAWGHKMKIPVTSYKPLWKDKDGKYNKAAGIMRNNDIVRDCTHMIAFPMKGGCGTQDSIRKAKATNKVLIVKWIELK